MKSGIKLNNMNFTLDQIEKASKYILEKDKNSLPDWVITKGLIQHLKELEESGEKSFNITWTEEDVANAHPEIPEEHRPEVLQMFEDEVNELDVWQRMWDCLNDVAQDFVDGLPAETIEGNAK